MMASLFVMLFIDCLLFVVKGINNKKSKKNNKFIRQFSFSSVENWSSLTLESKIINKNFN